MMDGRQIRCYRPCKGIEMLDRSEFDDVTKAMTKYHPNIIPVQRRQTFKNKRGLKNKPFPSEFSQLLSRCAGKDADWRGHA